MNSGGEKLKILLTGGSGFLGSHIAEQLARAGHEVVALVRKSSNRKFLSTLPGLTFAYGAVEDAQSVEQAVKGVQAIIHAAGLVKALSQEQGNLKNLMLSALDTVRDESDKSSPVRLVLEPRSSRQDPAEFMHLLLANTRLEASLPINLVLLGRDGRPRSKHLKQIIEEWIAFRFEREILGFLGFPRRRSYWNSSGSPEAKLGPREFVRTPLD